ncbi:hypothetical protein [Paenibacillus ginsengarvi]|nr:hypothetical protein [Paenibacillus ginsengarvi]
MNILIFLIYSGTIRLSNYETNLINSGISHKEKGCGDDRTPIVTSDAVKKELGKDSVYKDRNWNALVEYKFAPLALRPAYYSQLNAIYQKYFKAASLGESDLNTALRSAEEEAAKAISEFKNK